MRGALERADRWGVAGWVREGAAPLCVEVFADGRVTTVLAADRYRPDLLAAGEGDGASGFEAWFDAELPAERDHVIRVRLPDGRDLPGSPVVLAAAPPLVVTERLPDEGAPLALVPPLALVIDEAAPDAARDAGSAALLSHMAALRSLGYAVRFAPLADAARALADTAGRVRVAYLHRLRPALLAAEVRARNPGVWVVYALADLAHLRAARQALVSGGVAPRGLRAAELAAARAADVVVTHSTVEATLLERELPGLRAHWVPWAVTRAPVTVDFTERRGIGFLGSFGHAPNLDAADVLIDRVMPLVWRHADIPCVLAGHGMPDRLRARAGERVRVLDPLPDMATLWRQIRVSAAPLRFGAGVKGKVLDSLAAGIPCVCSPVAAEAIPLPSGLVAPDIPAMAATLLRLHENEGANAAAAAAGGAALHDAAVVARALGWALARR